MSQARAIRSLATITEKIRKSLKTAISPKEMKPIAQFAIDIIVKRTRLGYGVDKQFGNKRRLKQLTNNYIKYRQGFSRLDGTTAPSKSNLTLTGQMLRSMKIIRTTKKGGETVISFGPTGRRSDGQDNVDIATYQEAMGRTFNRISQLEYQQVLRFYRKSFGDLLRKQKLIS